MEVIPLLIILAIFCQNAITAKKNLQISRLMFDLTRPLNELIAIDISQQDFCADVNAAFNLIGANISTVTIFYTTSGKTIEELESRTQDACNILHETLNIDSDTQLLISWRFIGATKDKLNFSLPYNQTFDGCKPKLVLDLNDENGCDGIPKLSYYEVDCLFDSNKGFLVGVSYDESLKSCDSLAVWKYSARIWVVNLKFGTTRGVTESFGLFQTRMKFLSKTTEIFYQQKEYIYYPNPHSVGKDEHQNLLIRYASIWATSNKSRGSILLQVPNFRNNASEMEFSIMPMFERLLSSSDENILSSLLWFTASFRRHQMVFVNQYIWELWNILPKESIRPPKIRNVALTVDIPLYCTWAFDCNTLNTTSFQPTRSYAGNPTTFFIKIEDEVLPSLPPVIARRCTSESIFGCVFGYHDFKRLNESKIEHVVRSCQSINGSVYVLSTTITLEWYNEQEYYSFYFENTIRKELHAVNRIRKGILKRVPKAKVYLQAWIQERHGLHYTNYPESKLFFCDDLESSVNLYFEGIFNWAKLENFPVIKFIWRQDTSSYFSSWVSFSRKLNYPYPEWILKEKRIDQMQPSYVSSPAFLMQDYLKSVHDWEPDTCIDWTERRWEITDDFFHNPKMGTTFHPNSILSNRSLTQDEYITLLNFIFHRFRLVEISIGFDFGNLHATIEQKMVSRDFNTQIFVKHAMTEQQQNLSEFKSFIDQLIVRNFFGKGLLKGVHAELVLDSGINTNKNISHSINFQLVLAMIKYAKMSSVTCGIELSSVELCNQMLQNFTFSDVYSELIGTVNYLVCKEHFTWSYSKLELQDRLDSHLALKRTVDQISPHLQIYFRVEFDFEIDFKNNGEVDRYTSILALFKTFGTQYEISYFVGVAFDGESLPEQTGWWGIRNYTDLTNPQSYEEKVTVSRGYPMWYPKNLPASPSIIDSNTQDSPLVVILISVGSVVSFLLVTVGIYLVLLYRKLQHLSRFLSKSEMQEFLNGRVSANNEPTITELEILGNVEHMKFNQEYRLDLSDLLIDFEKILGSGAFGTVYKGLTKDTPAAIKRPNCSKSTFKSVLTEVKVLSYIGKHSNVVGFLGAYVEEIFKGVLYISMEFCALGCLESYLRKKTNVVSDGASNHSQTSESETSVLHFYDLNTFALEIAKGMEYIESRRVVHGDLSTRNVLLDENLVCKIGDFGLSRKLYEYQKYVKTSQEPLPWKWMAPESFTKMEFTSKTDLWSYGVTLWEIYTLGNIPYSGLNWTVDFANELKNGLRLPRPDFASPEIYAKLLECWSFNPDERPTFADMINFFNGLTEDAYMILNSVEEQPESTTE